MSFRSLVSSVILIAITGGLSACFSSSEVSNKNETTSVGQQLLDLDRARTQGIITEKEYTKLKKVIIKKND